MATTEHPPVEAWITPGSCWPGGAQWYALPTAMKAIKREKPPLSPAGLNKCDWDTRMRWIADEHRFPPYPYQDRFLFWRGDKWRLANPTEKSFFWDTDSTILSCALTLQLWKPINRGTWMRDWGFWGIAFQSTASVFLRQLYVASIFRCWNIHILWTASEWVQVFVRPLQWHVPSIANLFMGLQTSGRTVRDMNKLLLTRVNHTGSDIRITTGVVLSPKSVPRQSVQAAWWTWEPVFRTRWKQLEHINMLELRAALFSAKYQILHVIFAKFVVIFLIWRIVLWVCQ